MSIDAVVSWVDGADPKWLAERNQYATTDMHKAAERYRDWEILRYWFRSLDQYAPWIRKVFFVTWGHYPAWLETECPKLQIVRHDEFIPKDYLPTYSSRVIELNLHRIPGLSEQFIYFNDDMFIGKPVKETDFFVDGKPCASGVLDPITPISMDWMFGTCLLNVVGFANKHFDFRTVLKRDRRLWFNRCYGARGLMKNVLNSVMRKHFLGFHVSHHPSSMLKSTYEKVWEMEPMRLDRTSRQRFREWTGFNQYVMTYYDLCTGNFHPRSPRCGRYFDLSDDNSAALAEFARQRFQFICLNDSSSVDDFDTAKARLIEGLEKLFPQKSIFEKE